MTLAQEVTEGLMARLCALPVLPERYAIPGLALRVLEDALWHQHRILRAVTPLSRKVPDWPTEGMVFQFNTPRGSVRLEALPDRRNLLEPTP